MTEMFCTQDYEVNQTVTVTFTPKAGVSFLLEL